jgi:hypothetical protein
MARSDGVSGAGVEIMGARPRDGKTTEGVRRDGGKC